MQASLKWVCNVKKVHQPETRVFLHTPPIGKPRSITLECLCGSCFREKTHQMELVEGEPQQTHQEYDVEYLSSNGYVGLYEKVETIVATDDDQTSHLGELEL